MPTKDIRLSGFLPATPARIYAAWLSAAGHTAMTGSKATVESTAVGGRFTAWNGHIEGTHVALEPGKRIFQSWRAADFPRDAPESYVEVLLAPAPGGARVTIRHVDLPAKQAAGYLKGWKDYYLKPMASYFGRAVAKGKGGEGKRSPQSTRAPRAGAKGPSREGGGERRRAGKR